MKKLISASLLTAFALLTGCASVPMASKDQDAALKSFASPPQDKSGVYIYRDSVMGSALKKRVSIDGVSLGESAPHVYFYKQVAPGNHKLSTESEFGDNEIDLNTEGGKNYFVEQYIKMGVFVGGSNLKVVTEEAGKQAVLSCGLAASSYKYNAAKLNAHPSSSELSTTASNQSSISARSAAANTPDTRYMYQAEKASTSLGCTSTTYVSSGPGVEFYTAACGDHQVSIRCDFGHCTAQ